MSATVEKKTYRGRSLEDILPLIRAELGPAAVITKQRDGVVGGIGGFFGKKCVEVEAEATAAPSGPRDPADNVVDDDAEDRDDERGTARPPVAPSMPARSILDAYDAGGDIPATEALATSGILSRLLHGTAPFADHLERAEQRVARDVLIADLAPTPVPAVVVEGSIEEDDDAGSGPAPGPAVVPPAPASAPARRRAARASAPVVSEDADVRAALVSAGLPTELAADVLRAVEQHVRPFEPDGVLRDQVRSALARRIRVAHGWDAERRVVAVIGAAGSGKTTVVAKLCHAYATSGGLPVGALGLEGAEEAGRLAALTDHLDLDLRAASSPADASRAIRRLAREHMVVVDTPAVSAGDHGTVTRLGDLLDVLRADEVHLVVPATADPRATKALVAALGGAVELTQLVIARTDEGGLVGGSIGLAVELGRSISYVGSGRDVRGGLRPADPTELASLVLP